VKRNKFYIAFLLYVLGIASCNSNDFEKAYNSINTDEITSYVKIIGGDDFMGRKPFTKGEYTTVAYIASVFEQIGLKPANKGSYFQEVPLVEVSNVADKLMKFSSGKNTLTLNYQSDFVAVSRQLVDSVELTKNQLVFVGYGIVAPEYQWNDYQGVDVKGKTVVVLVNDPGLVGEDKKFFKGKEMTYYGRWTYKYEEAARQGAAAVLLVHNTLGAGYPWSVVVNGAVGSDLYLVPNDKYASRCKVEAWITGEAARKLFQFAQLDTNLIHAAAKPAFKAVEMNCGLDFSLRSTFQYKTSKNVLAYIEGSERPDEVIVYSAHWDHLGIVAPVNGDSIINGAVDNGTSLAWMFSIAKAFMQLDQKPKRSILFFAPTGEETGLIGSSYYVENPCFALDKTVANINNDLMLPYGEMRDVMITGFGQSELDQWLEKAAKKQNRYLMPDPNPHTGMYFRSDHFSFAKAGIPSLFARGNCDHLTKGKAWMQQKELDWLANNYHKTTDQYETWWDLKGVEQDAKLLFEVGYELSNSPVFPQWSKSSEFNKGVRK